MKVHNRAKLRAADVRKIRRLAATLSQNEIARRYCVDPATINRIVKRKAWKETK